MEEGTAEDMEVATQAGMVVTGVATEDIMEVMPVAGLEGLQQAPLRGVTLRIRILVCLRIRFRKIAPNLARSRGRRFQPRRLRTGLSLGLSSITLKSFIAVGAFQHQNSFRQLRFRTYGEERDVSVSLSDIVP